MKHIRKTVALLLALVLALTLAGCSGQGLLEEKEEPAVRETFAMDTVMTVQAYGKGKEKAVDTAIKTIGELDELLSTGKADSNVSFLNQNGGGQLSDDTNRLMKTALDLYESTDGVFDITIYPVMDLWGFTDQKYKVPSDGDLAKALALVDAGAIDYDAKTERIAFEKDGMQIDFGGIAKGYTSDTLARLMRDQGISSALINLGGNVQTVGTKPDGSDWSIGIRDPEDADGLLGIVKTHDKAVITSGGYERYFEEGGKIYHHIIDPSTGYPADSGLTSVTIVSENGTLADGLSTSLFIMGKEAAIDYWREHPKDFDFLLCEADGTLVVSAGLKNAFEAPDENTKVEYVS